MAFIVGPVSDACCDDPCAAAREDPCDPCEGEECDCLNPDTGRPPGMPVDPWFSYLTLDGDCYWYGLAFDDALCKYHGNSDAGFEVAYLEVFWSGANGWAATVTTSTYGTENFWGDPIYDCEDDIFGAGLGKDGAGITPGIYPQMWFDYV